MGATSIWHWLILLLIVVLLFGRGKISEIMGDVAKGIKSFKKGMTDDDKPADQKPADPKVIDNPPAAAKPGETATKPADPAPAASQTKVG